MAGFNYVLKTEYSHPSSNGFYLVNYDASYCERKYQQMQRISNSQKIPGVPKKTLHNFKPV